MRRCDVYLLQNVEHKSNFKWGISFDAYQRVKALPGYILRRRVTLRSRKAALKLECRLRGWTLYNGYNVGPSGEYFRVSDPKALARVIARFWPKERRDVVSKIAVEPTPSRLHSLSIAERYTGIRAHMKKKFGITNYVTLEEAMRSAVESL